MFNGYNSNPRNNYNQNRGGFGNNRPRQNDAVVDTSAEKLPPDYVDQAECTMRDLSQDRTRLTTSKIRNILSRISDIYNVEVDRAEDTLLPESESSLQMARVRIAYECGREESVKKFVERSKLLNYIKGIGNSRAEFIRFARYMEALVAYHRFFGGKDQ